MVLPEFHQFGGRHPEVGALRNVLAYLEVKAPHSGQPYGEALLFGLGGGVGFSYFLFEQAGAHPIHLGTRFHTRENEQPEFYRTIARRIRAPLQLQNSSSATAATANLERQIAQGHPVIAGVDSSRLPYLGLHRGAHSYYSVAVYGFDREADQVLLSDRCPQPLTVTGDELRHARGSSWSPKFRAVVSGKPPEAPALGEEAAGSIRETCRQMNEGLGIANFGLHGLEKWAAVVSGTREKKSWPKIFPPGPSLYEALFSIFTQIAARSDTGSAHRGLYAEFLDEAAALLSRPALADAAQAYRRAEEQWTQVADAHLPSSVPRFREARELVLRRRRLFESEGPGAARQIEEIRDRLIGIEREVGDTFPLSVDDTRALLADLRQRILKLRDAEAEALRILEAAIA